MPSSKINLVFLLLLSINSITAIHHRKQTYSTFLQQSELSYIDTPEVNYATGPCSQANCEKCVSASVCQCPPGYAQDPEVKVSAEVKSCLYFQKHQGVFFALELVFAFGVGHFYAGRIVYGVFKLLTLILIISIDISIKRCVLKQFSSKQKFNMGMYALYFAYLTWQLIDVICIGVNYFKDGKGIPLRTFST